MKIHENIIVPTGNILIVEGQKNKKLECLSIGDYGKENNLKADFLGLSKEINGVIHTDMLPLTEKWVVTISSQYGCSSACTFCDVPKVGPGINATVDDMVSQVKAAINLHPDVTWTNRLNIHFARMGEPTWNKGVLTATRELNYLIGATHKLHPVVSTMMPKKNKNLFYFLEDWLDIKDELNGEAGLQVSINTTSDSVRSETMPEALLLQEISSMFFDILAHREVPLGRKITLNFALTEAPIDAEILRDLFSPRYFICKITPMHITKSAAHNLLITKDGYEHYYPYKNIEENLKEVGFDVIVFVPSKEEDESRITCGNAILSDSKFARRNN